MDYNILLYLIIIIIPLYAQIKITTTYSKYKKIDNNKGLSGFEVARKILDANGLQNVYIVKINGNLTDHYDPSRKTVRLSKEIFDGETIAASSVAAHECGHAIQDSLGYMPMRIRSFLVPFASITSKGAWIVILIGLFTSYFRLFLFGIGLISIGLLFQIITLPVEFNASKRAKEELIKLHLLEKEENNMASSMLSAAAMTYVASVLTSILEILRLILIFNDNRR